MSEFHELIKTIDKCRDYVRDFFIYGFKSRNDFSKKSARTYDDERRRIESWLSEYVHTALNPCDKSKNVSLQIDSNLFDTNPLFRLWKVKSFTDNDILLHFFILDVLGEQNAANALSAMEIADKIAENYGVTFDTQIVRRKCNEYVEEGLLITQKAGKTLLYQKSMTYNELAEGVAGEKEMLTAICFYQLCAPFGYIGSTILDSQHMKNTIFRVKHDFPVFTLEDGILFSLITAIHEKKLITMEISGNRKNSLSGIEYGMPLKIFVSTGTGRRFLCFYGVVKKQNREIRYRFKCVRLDMIKKVSMVHNNKMVENHDKMVANPCGKEKHPCEMVMHYEEIVAHYDEMVEKLQQNLNYVWGTSFSSDHKQNHREKLELTLSVNEEYEMFILNRLKKEGRGGICRRLAPNTYLFEKIVFDANEMFPWLRTFIGRIIDIHFFAVDEQGEKQREYEFLRKKFLYDIQKLYGYYEN